MPRPVLTTLGVAGHQEPALAEGTCGAVGSLVWGSGSGETAMCSRRMLVPI